MEAVGPQSLLGGERCLLVGMVHAQPLPGSPRWGGSMESVLDAALTDAERLLLGGCDALLVENMGDVPYLKGVVPPETVSAMALLTAAVADLGLPVGLQILAAANREALGVAVTAGAHFIRVEGFAHAHVADEGWIDACAGPLLRARPPQAEGVGHPEEAAMALDRLHEVLAARGPEVGASGHLLQPP